jgi:hypothetical protein
MAGSLNGGFLKKSPKQADFAKGGNTPMFGKGDRTTTAPKDAAGTATPGETYKDPTDSGSKFAAGGSGKMFGYAGAQPAEAGKTSAR